MLVRLQPQADYWMVPEDVLLTSELLLWLSVTLVKLQKEERLSILPQGLLILLLYLWGGGPGKLTEMLPS